MYLTSKWGKGGRPESQFKKDIMDQLFNGWQALFIENQWLYCNSLMRPAAEVMLKFESNQAAVHSRFEAHRGQQAPDAHLRTQKHSGTRNHDTICAVQPVPVRSNAAQNLASNN